MMWVKYRRKYGPLNAARRVEELLARFNMSFYSAHMKKEDAQKLKVEDFLVHREREPEREATAADAFAELSKAFNPKAKGTFRK